MSRDFWSRRREAVAQEAEVDAAARLAAQEAETEAQLAERSDEELLTEAGLAPPEELDSPEAVREFLSSALPQRLKTRALRRLWRLNPVLANVDGLVDYGEDFTDSATVIENLQTAYQVGKGMLRHVEEMARQAEETALDEASEAALVETPEAELDAPDAPPVETFASEEIVAAAPLGPPADAELDAPPPAPRRRMTFTFDEQRTG